MPKIVPSLDLNSLHEPMPALTRSSGGRPAEAASVCLNECGHPQTVSLSVTGKPSAYNLTRLDVDDTMKACYDDPTEATEEGACGVAIVLLKERTGLSVVRRSRKGTGYDYSLGTVETLDMSARLEVSGIRVGTDSNIKTRTKQKREQTRQSDATEGELPAYAVVVEFGKPQAIVDKRN